MNGYESVKHLRLVDGQDCYVVLLFKQKIIHRQGSFYGLLVIVKTRARFFAELSRFNEPFEGSGRLVFG